MSKIIELYNKYIAGWLKGLNKYVVVGAVFFVITFLVGEASLWNRYKYNEKIRMLKREIERCEKQIEESRKQIEELRTDKEGLERFAREEYLMKRENEDVFIFSDE